MSDTRNASSKSKPSAASNPAQSAENVTPKATAPGFDGPKFGIPKFEIPRFEMPKFEVPSVFRDLAEKTTAQVKDNWEKMKAATEETTDLIEDSYATASKGAADYGLKLIEASRVNTNSAFDYAGRLLTVTSFSEAVELSATHARKQFETLTTQTKELTAMAQKVADEAASPLKQSVGSAFSKVA